LIKAIDMFYNKYWKTSTKALEYSYKNINQKVSLPKDKMDGRNWMKRVRYFVLGRIFQEFYFVKNISDIYYKGY